MDTKEHQEVIDLSQKLCKVSSKGEAAEVPRERMVQGEILVADVQLFPLNNLATLSEVSICVHNYDLEQLVCCLLWVPLNTVILLPKSIRGLTESLQVQKIIPVRRSRCLTLTWHWHFLLTLSSQEDALRSLSTHWQTWCAVLCPFTQQSSGSSPVPCSVWWASVSQLPRVLWG